jgi:hypothetical protein
MTPPDETRLETVLKGRLGRLDAADFIAGRSLALYRLGLCPGALSKAQVSAVGERIRRAENLAKAEEKAKEFIERQLVKLHRREEDGAKPSSWSRRLEVDGVEKKIGEVVVGWITERLYLPDAARPAAELGMLQRFWQQFEILYHFKAATHSEPDIKERACSCITCFGTTVSSAATASKASSR